MTFEEKL